MITVELLFFLNIHVNSRKEMYIHISHPTPGPKQVLTHPWPTTQSCHKRNVYQVDISMNIKRATAGTPANKPRAYKGGKPFFNKSSAIKIRPWAYFLGEVKCLLIRSNISYSDNCWSCYSYQVSLVAVSS